MRMRSKLDLTARHREALRIPLAFLPLAAALFVADGCTSMACLDWPADKGPCPSREDAFKRFGGQSCVADIVAVDSDAEVNEAACCYEVTKRARGDIGCGVDPDVTGPTGGTSGDAPPCAGCAAVQSGSAADLCESSVDIFNDLVACVCSGPCAEACDDGSCSTSFDTPECQACVADTENGCGLETQACENDP